MGDRFIDRNRRVRFLARQLLQHSADHRRVRHPANQQYMIEVRRGDVRHLQSLFNRRSNSVDDVTGEAVQLSAADIDSRRVPLEFEVDGRRILIRQRNSMA